MIWTLPEGIWWIRAIQQKIRPLGYHACLGGGVLNNGSSAEDLDVYFLPLNDQDNYVTATMRALSLRDFLQGVWGTEYPLGGGPEGGPYVQPEDTDMAYPPCQVFTKGRYTYRPGGRRIDVFIA